VQTSDALSLEFTVDTVEEESSLHCQYITTGSKTCCHDFSYTPATSGTTKIHKKDKPKEGCRHTNHTRHTGASSEYVSMVYYQKATQGVNSTDAGPPPVDAQPTSAMSKQDVMLPPNECFGLSCCPKHGGPKRGVVCPLRTKCRGSCILLFWCGFQT